MSALGFSSQFLPLPWYLLSFAFIVYLAVQRLTPYPDNPLPHVPNLLLLLITEQRKFSSVAQSCPTLCDPMDCSMPGFPVHHQLPELAQLLSIELVMPSNHLIFCRPVLLLPSVFPRLESFQMSQFFASGGQSICWSFSFSICPSNE